MTTLICCVFGGIETYQWLFRCHCRSLEPELFAYILSEDVAVGLSNSPDRFFFGVLHERPASDSTAIPFALGRDSNRQWVDPTESDINAINNPNVVPASRATEDQIVHYVANIKWHNWNTVQLDYGTVGFSPPIDAGATLIIEKIASGWNWKNRDQDTGWMKNAILAYPPPLK